MPTGCSHVRRIARTSTRLHVQGLERIAGSPDLSIKPTSNGLEYQRPYSRTEGETLPLYQTLL